MRTGLVIGKFLPPHKGHEYLLHCALAHCDNLLVLVCQASNDFVSAQTRAKWIQRMLPHKFVDVMIIPSLPANKNDDSAAWAAHVQHFIEQIGYEYYIIDVVISSEQYGVEFADKLGAEEHVMIDQERHIFPVSGTIIRDNIRHDGWFKNKWLPPFIAAHFVKRIVLVGAESAGKTTLSAMLAKSLNAPCVEEYGRVFAEMSSFSKTDWKTEHFAHIALTQNNNEDQAAEKAGEWLVCDTNSFATEIWHDRYMGFMSTALRKLTKDRTPTLYVVCGNEIPWVDDGQRDGKDIRDQMQRKFLDIIKARSYPYIIVTGDPAARLAQVLNAIKPPSRFQIAH